MVPQTREAARADLPGRPARRVQPADVPTRFHGNGENASQSSRRGDTAAEIAFCGVLALAMVWPSMHDLIVVLLAGGSS